MMRNKLLLGRIEEIGLSAKERQGILDVLFSGKSHREAGNGKRWTSAKRIQRARRRARAHGIHIPAPRRTFEVCTLADLSARRSPSLAHR